MRLHPGARVAVVGAGPGGLAAAKHAIEAGFDTSVFEASDDLGGQWHSAGDHSGIWPGMHTNTSRAMTAFSDFPGAGDLPLHPAAVQVHAYLKSYADRFGVRERIRLSTPVRRVEPGWTVNGEPFAGVIVASGRFRRPRVPPMLRAFRGELLHAFDYPGAEHFRDRRTLVYGNGVSGVEIASDIATAAPVVSAFRKSRYVLQKVVDGVSSDWQWYTQFGALEREMLPRAEFARRFRKRVIRVAGDPVAFGAPPPDPDILVAGTSLSQDYLQLISQGRIRCRPAISGIDGTTVTYEDGTSEVVEAIVSATGYDIDLPYLSPGARQILGPALHLHQRTLHPDLPGFGVVGQFLLQGPYFPLLELQARWIVGVWSGQIDPPDQGLMRRTTAVAPPPVDAHNALALLLSEEMGVAPDLRAHPDLAQPLLFGPMLPPRYRIDGPGARPDAARLFSAQVSASPQAAVDVRDVEALQRFGLGDVARTPSSGMRSSGATAR